MTDARFEAVNILVRIEKDKSYSAIAISDALKKIHFSDQRETSFAVSLIYGVLEHRLTLDYNISLYLKGSINRVKSNVMNIIRVGAYQLLYLDKIPVSAAVNESVKISKKMGLSFASGMINAVLRKIAENGLVLPDCEDPVFRMSVEYSVNADIVAVLVRDYDFTVTENILRSFSGRRPIYLRRNVSSCTEDEFIKLLSDEGVLLSKTSLQDCFSVEHTGDITSLLAFKKGFFHVQDMSSQLCCRLLDARADDVVLDCCAAPGGKSFTIAQYLTGNGYIISCDIYEHKAKLISSGAERLNIKNLKAVVQDARQLKESNIKADKVLCDVPCSGFGVMGRKPEIRYKSNSDFCVLPGIQREILYSAASCVKNGGTLIYSTCTLNSLENGAVCNQFLMDFPEFSVSEDTAYRELTDRFLTIFPDENHGDGFFIAKFTKR